MTSSEDRSADALFSALMQDSWTCLTAPVLADYGFAPLKESDQLSLFGLYQKMARTGVSTYEFNRAFTENKLDELIHRFYQREGETPYYKWFKSSEIVIGATNVPI